MKNIFRILLAPALLVACATQPPKESTSEMGGWESANEQAVYVNKAQQRTLAEAKLARYKTTGECGGFPKIDVKTAPGFCVGLVFDGVTSLKKARGVAAYGDKQVLLTDMGGWAEYSGAIYLMNVEPNSVLPRKILGHDSFVVADPRRGILDRPHQITRGPDGKFYVGAAGGVFRFDPAAARVAESVEVVIQNLPKLGLHPLKSFAFDQEQSLYVNVGSATNVCQNFTQFGDSNPQRNPRNYQKKQFASCPEAEDLQIGQAQIRKYRRQADGRYSSQFEIFAKGLRNSIALVWDQRRSVLIQGDNGRDAINKYSPELSGADLPHEEVNIVKAGQHYGWPYCYDNNRNNPEWPNIDCQNFAKPYLLLPGHSAPLGFLFYEGAQFPEWYKGRLLMALHGYEAPGHRIVTMKRDQAGLPTGVAQSIVYDWETRGDQQKGKPVQLAEMPDGSVLIVEDEPQNKVLRLFFDQKMGDGRPVQEIDQIAAEVNPEKANDESLRKQRLEAKLRSTPVPPFVMFESKVIDRTCFECHQTAGAPGVQLIRYDDEGNAGRILDAGKGQEILEILRGNPKFPVMPPQGWDDPKQQKEAAAWLEAWLKSVRR